MAERSMYGHGPPKPLPKARFVLGLLPGEHCKAVGGGFVVVHPDHLPVMIRFEDGAMFCERITIDG